MIRWTPTRPALPPQRWQSREEILKRHLDSLSPDELFVRRPDYYWLRFGPGALKRSHALKYDPNQPRVPAGSAGGGQWTGGGANGDDGSVESILAQAQKLAASNPSMSKCVDLCLPLLIRPQPPGSDRNEFDFRRCLNKCLGRLGQ